MRGEGRGPTPCLSWTYEKGRPKGGPFACGDGAAQGGAIPDIDDHPMRQRP